MNDEVVVRTIEQVEAELARANAELGRKTALLQRLAEWDDSPSRGSSGRTEVVTKLVELLPILGAVRHELSQ